MFTFRRRTNENKNIHIKSAVAAYFGGDSCRHAFLRWSFRLPRKARIPARYRCQKTRKHTVTAGSGTAKAC